MADARRRNEQGGIGALRRNLSTQTASGVATGFGDACWRIGGDAGCGYVRSGVCRLWRGCIRGAAWVFRSECGGGNCRRGEMMPATGTMTVVGAAIIGATMMGGGGWFQRHAASKGKNENKDETGDREYPAKSHLRRWLPAEDCGGW